MTLALESADMGFWDWDLNDRLGQWSLSCHQLFGLPRSTFTGRFDDFYAYVHREDRARVVAALELATATGRYESEHRVLRPDGQIRWLSSRGKILEGSSRLVGVTRDCTAEREVQQRLDVQYGVARTISETSDLGKAVRDATRIVCEHLGWSLGLAWVWDRRKERLRFLDGWPAEDGRFARLSQACAARGFTPGVGLPRLVLESRQPVFVADLARDPRFPAGHYASRAGMSSAFGFPVMSDQGFVGVLEFFSRWAPAPDAAVVDLIASFSRQLGQLIERRKAETNLRANSAELAAIIDAAPSMIWFRDRHGRVLRCNKAAASSIGRSVEEVVGKTLEELYPKMAATFHARDLEVIIKDKASLGVIEPISMPRGGRRHYQTDRVPFHDEAGRSVGAVVFATDITERVAAERLLRDNERNQRDFVANVSHEFRTPVAAIKGFAETLRSGGMDDAKHRMRFVRIIENHADRLRWLVEDMLMLSSLESGSVKLKLEPVDLSSLIGEHVEGVAALARKRGVKVSCVVTPGCVALADRQFLVQVLDNLIGNAIKYNKRRGWVRVEARRGAGVVRLTIRDGGIGISAEHLPRIFDRFFRANKGAAPGSTGLGLHIVKTIVEAHGGTIWVTSAFGRGSAFRVSLPSPDRQ